MHRLLAFLVFIPLLLAPGCLCETTGVNRGDVNLVGLDEEWAFGEQLAQQIVLDAPVLDDLEVQAYVDRLGQRIAAETELRERPWRFHVLASPEVNAFNIPGGHVFVHAGLLAAAGSTAEVAGVIAHEVAHGVARHGTERMTKAYGLNVIVNLLMGQDAGMIEQIAAQIAGSGALAKFSRDDEREADRLGLGYLLDAGYAPSGMASMFETMLALRSRRPNAVERFFSTHPLTEERIAAVREAAAQVSEDELVLHDEDFRRVRARVEAYAPAEGSR